MPPIQPADPPRRSVVEQHRVDAALTELFERSITFNQVLGLRAVDLGPASSAMTFGMKPELVGHHYYGRLHGGVISATLDATGGFGLMCAIADKFGDETTEQILHRYGRFGTIDLRVDYLRPGLGQTFTARANVTRLGGRVGSVQMTLHNQDGLLIATGAGAYIVA